MAKMRAEVSWTCEEIIEAMRAHKPHWVPWPEEAEVNHGLTHPATDGNQRDPNTLGLKIVVQWEA